MRLLTFCSVRLRIKQRLNKDGKTMAIILNHTIVPAHDKVQAAEFFAHIFGLPFNGIQAPFAPIQVNDDLTLDFFEVAEFEPHHYAFLVSDSEFDAMLNRIKTANIPFGSAPISGYNGQINHDCGGRRVYFPDPNGHKYELLTRV
jgi:catechol 2,3-dioxygenase-like lactoylglutathione lyase family enzyme